MSFYEEIPVKDNHFVADEDSSSSDVTFRQNNLHEQSTVDVSRGHSWKTQYVGQQVGVYHRYRDYGFGKNVGNSTTTILTPRLLLSS